MTRPTLPSPSPELEAREFRRIGQLMCHPRSIFVFGSNRAGMHGGGAALTAQRVYGAVRGVGEGLRGRTYALPTKGHQIETLPIDDVAKHVKTFLEFARANPQLTFAVTRIGCGLAGFTDDEIAPLFQDAPANCELPEGWRS